MRAMVVPSGPCSANSAVAASLRRRRVPSVSQAMRLFYVEPTATLRLDNRPRYHKTTTATLEMEFLNMANSIPGVGKAPGGTLRLADDLVLSRIGFGAMQLAVPGVFGPPRDPD